MHGRHTNLDQRATQRDGTGPTRDRLHRHRALVSGAVLSAALLTACSDEGSSVRAADATAPASTVSATTPATTASATTEATSPESTERTASTIGTAPGATESTTDEERIATVRTRRQAMAEAALLRPEDLGDDWQDLGPASVFPMTSALAASLPSCTSFVEPVFEDDDGVWAHRALGRDADVAFTSVTVFASEADAAAMVAATAEPAFDQCWADFNEVAVVELAFGVESADYESVDPPDIELGGDSSSLQALEGTVTFGSTSFPDTCVCAFVQQGRTVVTFHAAAHVFGAAERHDLIVAATARIDDEVE